jgi:hypothetical protein
MVWMREPWERRKTMSRGGIDWVLKNRFYVGEFEWGGEIRNRMEAAYIDKLDGKIDEEFWERKTGEWRLEEQQVRFALDGLAAADLGDRAVDAQRVLELAKKAYLLYVSRDSTEKANLLRMLCSNFSLDAVSVTPAYRYSFDLIFKRVKMEEWSALLDDFRTFRLSTL